MDQINNKVPGHIAIIMDGNGRWAGEKNLPRTAGHREGVNRVREIITAADDLGVKVLTLFAFSAENWKRPRREIDILMRFLVNFLDREINKLHKNNIRFRVVGKKDPLPGYILSKISLAEEKTKGNTGLTLVLALNYGSRQEIVEAAKKIADSVVKGKINLDDLDVEGFSKFLYASDLPDPDLLIRTSGEMRLSNFLLWQLSYSELYFAKKYWPDFKAADLEKAIGVYQNRERRFGGVDVDKKSN
ncbi:MAG: isoprenyl transferase [Candidatus Omnitrophota bacterium]